MAKRKVEWDQPIKDCSRSLYQAQLKDKMYRVYTCENECLCEISDVFSREKIAFTLYSSEEGFKDYKNPLEILNHRSIFHQPLNERENGLVQLMFLEASKTLVPRVEEDHFLDLRKAV